MNKNRLHNEVEATLELLNQEPKTETNPFFYTRVMASIESRQQKTWIPNFLLRPVFAAVLIINILVISLYYSNSTEQKINEDDYYSLLADDYSFTTYDYFNYEPENE